MGPLSPSDVVEGTAGRACGFGSAEVAFADVVTDSRAVRSGSLFWALPGSSNDGHEFVGEAIRRGAAGAVVRAGDPRIAPDVPRIEVADTLRALADLGRWTRRRHDVLAIGVTGSVGKTTTREMLHAVLSRSFRGTRSRANLNNHVGLPLCLLDVRAEHEFAVLEMGASAVGEIRALAEVAEPEVGIVTAIAPAHVEGFGSLEGIVRGKGELVEALPSSGFAVLAGDDPLVRTLAARAACRAILYGESHDVDLRAEAVLHDFDGLAFRVDGQAYALPATGRHHLSAALAAIAVGREFGMRPEDIAAGLLDFRPVAGRSRSERIGPWLVLDDTYNANPASMRAACDVLASWPGRGRRLFVAGDMLELGPEAPHWHRELGRQATQAGADRLVAFGRHADDVVRGAVAHGMAPHRLAACEDLETVLLQLDCWLEPGDLVAVKGSRGMRMERIVDWLRERATEFPVATASLRDCA